MALEGDRAVVGAGAPPQVAPDPILQLATGFMTSKHLFVANAVGLFEHLADGPLVLDELARRTAVPRRTIRILADAMVALGLVERTADGYQNRPVASAYLAGRTPADLRPLLRFWDRISYPTWLNLKESVRSGQAQTRQGRFSAEDQQVFSEGVEALTAASAAALAASNDFSRHRRILDRGGGTGSFLIAALHRHGEPRGTLFELPTVATIARQRLDREPVGPRVDVVAGDFFQDALPTGHDAIIVANVVHLFSPEQNAPLLRRARQSMAEGGRLLLVDLWTDPTKTRPLPAPLMAGEFLMLAGDGDVYSEEELRGWLQASGWRPVERRPLTGPASLVVAEAV